MTTIGFRSCPHSLTFTHPRHHQYPITNKQKQGAQRPFNVVVTSYEGVLKERAALEKIQWRYVIIDEVRRVAWMDGWVD